MKKFTVYLISINIMNNILDYKVAILYNITMLKIKHLTTAIEDQELVNDISLDVKAGEIHAIMGPAHSGKSYLVHAIIGVQTLAVKEGTVTFKKKSIADKNIYERSLLGIFASWQDPPIIDYISNFDLAKIILAAHNDIRKPIDIEKDYKALCSKLGLSSNHGHKMVNYESMTMTERKKNEILHMWLLDPSLIVLDEIDAGVESDELEDIAKSIKSFLIDKTKAAIIVTHSQKLLDILEPTHVHVMVDGEIRETGSTELYKRIVEDGYTQFS